jgi:hypothetical protein
MLIKCLFNLFISQKAYALLSRTLQDNLAHLLTLSGQALAFIFIATLV